MRPVICAMPGCQTTAGCRCNQVTSWNVDAKGRDGRLRLSVEAVLEADTEYRSMHPEWKDNPLSDEIHGLRRLFDALPTETEQKENSSFVPVQKTGTVVHPARQTNVEASKAFAEWLNSGPDIAKAADIEVEIVAVTAEGGTLKLTSAGFPEKPTPQTKARGIE